MIIKSNLKTFFLFFIIIGKITSQEKFNEYTVKYISTEINIDGRDDEKAWDSAKYIFTKWTNFPNVSDNFDSPTEVKIIYDDTYIYILCKALTKSKEFVVPSLKWDFSGRAADKINLVFDTFSDGTNAYHFGSNMLGVKADALISNGGVLGTGNRGEVYNRSWDG